MLLVLDVVTDHRLVPTHRRYEVPTCPEMMPHKTSLALPVHSSQVNRAFTLDETPPPATPRTSAESISAYARGQASNDPLRFRSLSAARACATPPQGASSAARTTSFDDTSE